MSDPDRSTTHPRPFAVDPSEYPFEDHWFMRDGTAMHYVDEGTGVPVILLHGNPTWSFLYRHVIKQLAGSCRSIAPDYPGFGFSEHPPGYGYTPQEHAQWIAVLIDHLELERFVLVVQDWGGPIGLSVAVERPQAVAGLVLLNTWCWPPDWWLRGFSYVMGGAALRPVHLRNNTFVRYLVPAGIVHEDKKTPEILEAYLAPFPTPEARLGTYVFARSIRTAAPWLRTVEAKLVHLLDKPIEMVWAMKDVAFGWEKYIDCWLDHFPDTPVDRIDDAGHYLHEDRPDRIVEAVRRLLQQIGQ